MIVDCLTIDNCSYSKRYTESGKSIGNYTSRSDNYLISTFTLRDYLYKYISFVCTHLHFFFKLAGK